MDPLEISKQIQLILKTNFGIDSLIKGSCGYGVPSSISDVDIQLKLDNPGLLKDLREFFQAKELKTVEITDNDGNTYTSYMMIFKQNDTEISLLYDDNPKVYELVESILKDIPTLPIDQKYILRLVGGSYKYMGKDAYKIIIEIFNKLSSPLKADLLQSIKNGDLIDKEDAQVIRKAVQALFVNETNCKYPRKFLI